MAVIGIALLAAVTIAQATMTPQHGTPSEPVPQFDVSAGAQFTHRPGGPIKRDWLLSSGFRINEWFDYVVEVGWYRRQDVRPVTAAVGSSTGSRLVTDHQLQVATGIRGRLSQERRVTPFYQGLVGLFIYNPTSPQEKLLMLGPWDTDAPIYLQPGAGLDVAIRPELKVRVAADLMMVVFEGHLHNAPRASVGIAAQF